MRENGDEKREKKTTTARRCWDEGKRYKCLCMQWQWDLLAHTLNFPLLVRSHVCVSVCSYHVVCMLDSCVKHTRSRVMMCIALHLLGWNLNISINSLFKLYSEFGIHKHTHTRFHIHTSFGLKSIFLCRYPMIWDHVYIDDDDAITLPSHESLFDYLWKNENFPPKTGTNEENATRRNLHVIPSILSSARFFLRWIFTINVCRVLDTCDDYFWLLLFSNSSESLPNCFSLR